MYEPKHRILFQSDPHSYIDPVTGQVVDSTTQIIARHGHGYQGPPGFSGRGTYIHEVNEIFATGDDIDDALVPPEWSGYVGALRRFYEEQAPRVHLVEVPLYHPSHGHAGTPDLWCSLPKLDAFMAVVEAKSGDHRGADLQVGASCSLIRENFSIAPSKAFRLQIGGDGRYQLVPYDLRECEQDWLALMRLEMRRRRNGDR